MTMERFFTTAPNSNPNADVWTMTSGFNQEMVDAIRKGSIDSAVDVEDAIDLAALVHDELRRYGTDGSQRLNNPQITSAVAALNAVLRRLAITDVAFRFRDFDTFKTHWMANNAGGSWQARRDLLEAVFGSLHLRLQRLEETTNEALANPVSPRAEVGWPTVDIEIQELRRRFRGASTAQDYRAIGTHCIGVLEALSRKVYDPTRHLRQGETTPAPDKTKQRISRYVEIELSGPANVELRGLVLKTVDLAQCVKHSTTPTRRDAGIAADAVILLANMLRRLQD